MIAIKKFKYSNRNLNRYFGFIFEDRTRWRPTWMDHGGIEKWDDGNVCLVGYPYQLYKDDLEEITKICRNYNLTVFIDGAQIYGNETCRVVIRKEKKPDTEPKTEIIKPAIRKLELD